MLCSSCVQGRDCEVSIFDGGVVFFKDVCDEHGTFWLWDHVFG